MSRPGIDLAGRSGLRPAGARIALAAALVLLAAMAGLAAEDQGPVPPLPTLPPEPRGLQMMPASAGDTEHPASASPAAGPASATAAGAPSLLTDITALKHAVERVQTALSMPGTHGDSPPSARSGAAPGAAPEEAIARHTGDAVARASSTFGADHLTVLRYPDGFLQVTAALDHVSADSAAHELAALCGVAIDDTQVPPGHRSISLHLDQVAWNDAFDRLLGQVGIGWRNSAPGPGPGPILVLSDLERHPMGNELLEQQAEKALLMASRDRTSPTGVEALYLMAQHAYQAGRFIDAMRRFSDLADEFSPSKDRHIHRWVQLAIRGTGDAMMGLDQFQEARGVYLNYITHADEGDPDLPAVFMAAAEAGRKQGLAHQDAVAFDDAIDLLHTLLERFADKPAAAAVVHAARWTLGELLFDAGRYREAEAQLRLFASASGGQASDQMTYWLAECAYHQDHVDAARQGYEQLYRTWKRHQTDPLLPPALYATAAFRIGQCYLGGSAPQYVHALFSFLRARQDFAHSPLDAEILIAIARCYSELQRDDDTVATLWELLKDDAVADGRPAQAQLDQLLGEVEGRLGDYRGPIRAKVLFYIAQADYRRALRDRANRAAACDDAIHHYGRVLDEHPSSELRSAARIGLARVALLGGQDDLGVQTLRELLRDDSLSARDRAFSAQVLGSYYQEKGQLRAAIRAYQGEVSE